MNESKIDDLLDSIEPRDFELFIGDLFESFGWETQVTTQSGDMGIDVIARQNKIVNLKLLIQVKKYSKGNSVDRSEVQQYAGLYRHENNVSSVVIVTTSKFGNSAEKVAKESGIDTIDRGNLIELIQNHNPDFIEEYSKEMVDIDAIDNEMNKNESNNSDIQSNIKLNTIDEDIPISVSLLGFTDINVNKICSGINTDRDYKPCAFLEIHNKTGSEWTTTPKSFSLSTNLGYVYEPDWINVDRDKLPATWKIGRQTMKPGDKARMLVIFPNFGSEEVLDELRYEESVEHGTSYPSDLLEEHPYQVIKQNINPNDSELTKLKNISFMTSAGEVITK